MSVAKLIFSYETTSGATNSGVPKRTFRVFEKDVKKIYYLGIVSRPAVPKFESTAAKFEEEK